MDLIERNYLYFSALSKDSPPPKPTWVSRIKSHGWPSISDQQDAQDYQDEKLDRAGRAT